MKFVTAETMREIERRTMEEYNVPGELLMDRAGGSVADLVGRLADACAFQRPRIHLIAGRGNNGGDAFVAARYLKDQGCVVDVWVAGMLNQMQGDALLQLSRLSKAGIDVVEMSTMDHWLDALENPYMADIIVDGLLGTGLSGPVRGPSAGAIQYINQQSRHSLCVSIDLPSGLNADTGRPSGDAVRADVTATIGLPKLGFTHPDAVDYLGTLEVLDIGFPLEFLQDAPGAEGLDLLVSEEMAALFPRRKQASHKGNYGHALVIAGSRRYAGAATLASVAALRSGAGLVTVCAPACLHACIASQWPELMVIAAPEDANGQLSPEVLAHLEPMWDEVDSVLIGPGLGQGDGIRDVVSGILSRCPKPMVLDASALSVFNREAARLLEVKPDLVLTPHPGEMAALLGIDTAKVQARRHGYAHDLAALTGAVTVLKGAGTVVAQPGNHPLSINLNGNPGMATAGAGDVLAGVITGLIASGLSPASAARAGVYVHGKAGDLSATRRGQVSMVAGDILEDLVAAFRELLVR